MEPLPPLSRPQITSGIAYCRAPPLKRRRKRRRAAAQKLVSKSSGSNLLRPDVSPSPNVFTPLKAQSRHSYLQRFITALEGLRPGVRGRRGREQRSGGTIRTCSPACVPQGRVLGGIPGSKAQTKRNKAAAASPSSRHAGEKRRSRGSQKWRLCLERDLSPGAWETLVRGGDSGSRGGREMRVWRRV